MFGLLRNSLVSLGIILSISIASQRSDESSKTQKPIWLQIGLGTKPFDVTRHSVELDQIVQGGPARDGIPALVDPKFVSAWEARKFLSDKDEVLGVEENGVAKAYPLKILNHHEVVNDRIGDRPITVTY